MIHTNLEEASVHIQWKWAGERVLYHTIHPMAHSQLSLSATQLRSQPQPCRYYSLPYIAHIYISFASARRATRRFAALQV